MHFSFHRIMKHRRKLLAALAVVCMIAFGVTYPMMAVLSGIGKKSSSVGEVFGKPVSVKEYRELEAPVACLSQSQRVNPSLLLYKIAEVKLAQRAGMGVSQAELSTYIRNQRQFWTYQGENQQGGFSSDLYYAFLKLRGLLPTAYEELMRKELLARKLQVYFAEAGPVTTAEAWLFYRENNRKYKVNYVVFKQEDFLAAVSEPSEEEVKTHYQENDESLYAEPERVKLQYLSIAYAALKCEVELDEAEMEQYYQEYRSLYRIRKKETADEGEDEVSTEQSTDQTGSTSEEQVPEPAGNESEAEQEASSDEGAPSTPDDEPEYKSFAEVRDEIEELLRTTKAKELAREKLAEARSHLVFEEETLTFADLAKLEPDIELGQTEFFSREEAQNLEDLKDSASEEGKFGEVVFSLDAELDIPSPVMVGEEGVYLFRLVGRQPKHPIPLGEARERVVRDLKRGRAREMAEAKAQALLDKLATAAKSLAEIAVEEDLEVAASDAFAMREAPPYARGTDNWKLDVPQVVPHEGDSYLVLLKEIQEPAYSEFEKEEENTRRQLTWRKQMGLVYGFQLKLAEGAILWPWRLEVLQETRLQDFTTKPREPRPQPSSSP